MTLAAAAVIYFAAHGWLYYYGDAESHLDIARRLVDNSTPGWDQLGTPWLPLPHLLIAPFAAITPLWRDGLAGSIPSAACFVAAALFLFFATYEILASYWAAWTAMLILLLNPNALYLQSTAMTEPVFAAALCGLLFFTVRFRRTQEIRDVVGAAICALAGTLTRYEGWFLLPFCAFYFLITARRRWRAAILFSAIAGAGPVTWFFYNWWLSGNLLNFANGEGSSLDIQGGKPYPGLHDWATARLYYNTCVRLVLGPTLYWVLAAGAVCALVRRTWWPVLLLALPPAFYVWSMHSSGGSPIFMPTLWPYSWYNTRYGLAALPLAAFCGAAVTRSRYGLVVVALAAGPWVMHPSPERWVTWNESERNSISRREWVHRAASYLELHVRPGEHVAAEFSDVTGVFRYAGIPLRDMFHPGNSLQWQAAIQRPDLFLHTTWVVCQDAPWSPLCRTTLKDADYTRIKTVAVGGAPPLEIFHRVYSFHESARREERLSVDDGFGGVR